ncbi:MAG TPA: 3-oxoacyl-ACP reductase FabG [Gammaproteobacteria bacterium]|nr:3-oxoacyl-ACP reductase FabG [Gammaproteobacteria bacterium]
MKQRRVLVTGASGGIGAAIARALHSMGFAVTLHYHRNAAKAEALAQELGGARMLSFDLTDRDGARAALEQELEAVGAFWGVVCNAGVTQDNTFAALSGADWDKVVDTNLGGFYNVLHPLIMPLVRLRDGGRVVTIASVSGIMGNRGQTNYSAAKAGLIGASKALAIELASRKITVNCVAPGLIETDMTGKDLPLEEILKQIPLGRAGTPEEVAALVAYLFSEPAAYVTRQVLSINGGML